MIVRKDHQLSKISLIVNPAKGCLTCFDTHTYTCKTNRGRIVVKNTGVSLPHHLCLGIGKVRWEKKRGRVGAYLPKWVPRTEIVQPTVPQKRQLTHALPQVRATSINCLQLQSSPLLKQCQSPRLCFYEHTQSLVTLYNCPWNLLPTGPTTAKLSLQTSFFKFHEKKNMKSQSELGILFSLLWRVSK